jgi:hypothetical protein
MWDTMEALCCSVRKIALRQEQRCVSGFATRSWFLLAMIRRHLPPETMVEMQAFPPLRCKNRASQTRSRSAFGGAEDCGANWVRFAVLFGAR